ncbi:MAG: hypothetical protein H6739_15780 [Alphaproteobacteria bacterium]|nr:hypothetical protein [Alphaproteobacteria bacterium]
MARHKYEGEQLPLTAVWKHERRPQDGQVIFELFLKAQTDPYADPKSQYEDGKFKKTVTLVEETRGVWKASWTDLILPDVPTTAASLEFEIKVRSGPLAPPPDTEENAPQVSGETKDVALDAGGENITLAETVVVWPRELVISSTSPDDQPRAGVDLRLIQKNPENGQVELDDVYQTIGTDATLRLGLGHGPFEVSVVGDCKPLQPLQPKAGNLRDLVAKVKYVITAKIIAPVSTHSNPFDPIRQYVNLESANAGTNTEGQDGKGRQVEIVVGPKDANRADVGSEVFVEVDFIEYPQRDNLRPTVMGQGFQSTGEYRFTLQLDSQKEARFKVYFGVVGGHTCDVRVGGKSGERDADVSFENWRKLYYELVYPDFLNELADVQVNGAAKKDMKAEVKAKVTERLKGAYIEYELRESQSFTSTEATAGTVYPADYIGRGGGGDVLILGDPDLAGTRASPKAFQFPNDPRTVNIWMAHATYSSSAGKVAHIVKELTAANAEFKATSRYSAFFTHSMLDNTTPTVVLANSTWKAQVRSRPWVAGGDVTVTYTEQKDSNNPVNGVVRLDLTAGATASTLNITFAKAGLLFGKKSDTLNQTQREEIKTWVWNRLASITGGGKAITIAITGEYTHPKDPASQQRRRSRYDQTFAALQQICDDYRKAHPGLDPATGNPREGTPDNTWTFTHTKLDTIDVVMPSTNAADPGSFAGPAAANTCPVLVSLEVIDHYSLNGAAMAGKQILKNDPSFTDGARSSTVVHELGHLMGMTPFNVLLEPPSGMTPDTGVDNGGLYYFQPLSENLTSPHRAGVNGFRKGHQGPHCASGVGDKTPHDYSTIPGGDCIMWGSGGTQDSRSSFCATCMAFLQARVLDDIRAHWLNIRLNGVDPRGPRRR